MRGEGENDRVKDHILDASRKPPLLLNSLDLIMFLGSQGVKEFIISSSSPAWRSPPLISGEWVGVGLFFN